MNIEALAGIFHDDSNGLITSISRSENNELLISIECDDWKIHGYAENSKSCASNGWTPMCVFAVQMQYPYTGNTPCS